MSADAAFWTILTIYAAATVVMLAWLRRDSHHHDPVEHPDEERQYR